jgi:hypothetical protein
MKRVIYEDDEGYRHVSLIRDSDPDTMAPLGVACDPPDVRDLDWENIWREMNNLLVDRGFTNLQSLNISGLDNSIITPIKRRLVTAYKNKEKI